MTGQGSFDYSVLFLLPKEKAASRYGCLFNSFTAKGWVAREPRTMDIEEFTDLVDGLQKTYLGDNGHGPTVADMVTFLCRCPELCRKGKMLTIFWLNCLCIGHLRPVLPSVKFGSAVSSSDGPDLSEIIEPVQNCSLSSNVENKIFTSLNSFNECVALLDGFAGSAFHRGYTVWT